MISFMKQKKFYALTLFGLMSPYLFAGVPILSITPNLQTVYMRSDGSAVVDYTVTNNTSTIIKNILIDQLPQGGSIQNNLCTGTLSSKASCTFQMLLQNQTSNLILSPRVCAYNGAVCSVPPAANRTQVDVIQVNPSHPITAYFGLQGLSQLQPINTLTRIAGTPINGYDVSAINFPQDIAVSPDGTKVYGATNSSNSVTEYDVNSGSIVAIIDHTNYPAIASTFISAGVAISPDGKMLYLTDLFNGALYVFNISSGLPVYVTTVQFSFPSSNLSVPISVSMAFVTVSPDGRYVYTAAAAAPPGGLNNTSPVTTAGFFGAVVDTVNNYSVTYFPISGLCSGIALTPDGTQLYLSLNSIILANHPDKVGSVPNKIVVYNTADLSLSSVASKTINMPSGQGVSRGLSFSPDGNTLYVAESGGYAGKVTNLSASSPTIYTTPIDSGAFGACSTPNGSNVYFSTGSNVDVLDANFSSPVQTISVPAAQTTEGKFIG